jgi:PPK2 family polyphosphate:nucleotide phosphotransferase
MDLKKILKPFCVSDGKKFSLKHHDPASTQGIASKKTGEAFLRRGVEWLAAEQAKLYAQDRWSLLLIFQAMDAAGKDGAIRHVMSGINPQGCQVYSFKAPSAEDLDHDFLWRTNRCLPERGRIGIFNRSYYEEVLVVRVHPEFLARQRVPPSLVTKDIWRQRFTAINATEKYLAQEGVVIRKFFLHVSKEEQKQRFLQRLTDPDRNWKFSNADLHERKYWDEYMDAYEDAIRHTATEHAPWYVIPADHKWFTRVIVAGVIVDALSDLKLAFPKVSTDKRKELETVRQGLIDEPDKKREKQKR